MVEIEQTLEDRNAAYGDWILQAAIAQNIKEAMKDSRNWPLLSGMMKETLEMIAHKISRILNGDPGHIDSWHDIVGYAALVEKELLKVQEEEHALATASGQLNVATEPRAPYRGQ